VSAAEKDMPGENQNSGVSRTSNHYKGETWLMSSVLNPHMTTQLTHSQTPFVAWLRRVHLNTLAGYRLLDTSVASFDHPLANWLTETTGSVWSVRALAATEVQREGAPFVPREQRHWVAQRWEGNVVLSAVLVPTWALPLCEPARDGELRLTSADCLQLLGEEMCR
jgi:hypothetical protein